MKHLLPLLLILPAFGAEFLEVRNADTNIVRTLRNKPADWTAPAHKFGADKATRFVRVVSAERPTNIDEAVYELAQVTTLTDTEAVRSWSTNRIGTPKIIKAIRSEAQRRVNLIVTGDDAITLLSAIAEIHDKQLAQSPVKLQSELSNADQNALTDARALWARAKAIRVHAKALITNAATITTIMEGWPE